MTQRNLTDRRRVPGTRSSRFDGLVRLGDAVETIPPALFAVLLFLLALVPTLGNLPGAIVLWLFFLGDWALLAALPRAGKSYGPAKPPTLILAVLRLVPAALPFPLNWLAQAIGTALVIYGFWIEPHRIRVTYQSYQTPKWKAAPGVPPLRLLHLGDLHVERITQRERELVDLVRSLRPDLILFSGDFLNLSTVYDPVAWDHARQVLGQITAPLGVHVVTGSPPVDKPEVIARLVDGLGIRWLQNERVCLDYHGQPLDIVGVTCTHYPAPDSATLDAVLEGDPDNLTILLYHTPDLAPSAAEDGIDLQLSGHTHGGQVRLPFFGALYTSSLYWKRFEAGRYQVGGMTLYVTRGLGLEGKGAPRVRFLCPPEIVLWEIAPQAD